MWAAIIWNGEEMVTEYVSGLWPKPPEEEDIIWN